MTLDESRMAQDRVEAAGKMTEALEWVERARGHLYDFHHMMGHADRLLAEAIDAIEAVAGSPGAGSASAGSPGAGPARGAEALRRDLLGRDVLEGRWTFHIVEEFDDGYWTAFRRAEQQVREELVGGRRHLLEARMRESEQAEGRSR